MMRLPNDYYDFVQYINENELKYEYVERAIKTLHKVEIMSKRDAIDFGEREIQMLCDNLVDITSIKTTVIKRTIIAYLLWRNKKRGRLSEITEADILSSKVATFHPLDYVSKERFANTYIKDEEQLEIYIREYLDNENNPVCILPAILIWMGIDASDIPWIKIKDYTPKTKTLVVNNKDWVFNNEYFAEIIQAACLQDALVVNKPNIEPMFYSIPVGENEYLIRGFKVCKGLAVSDSYVSRRIKTCFEKTGLIITSTVLKRSGMYYRMYQDELKHGYEYISNRYTNYVIQDYKKYKMAFKLNTEEKSTK